jgi:tetratricopeptide (TPR) repeat protein
LHEIEIENKYNCTAIIGFKEHSNNKDWKIENKRSLIDIKEEYSIIKRESDFILDLEHHLVNIPSYFNNISYIESITTYLLLHEENYIPVIKFTTKSEKISTEIISAYKKSKDNFPLELSPSNPIITYLELSKGYYSIKDYSNSLLFAKKAKKMLFHNFTDNELKAQIHFQLGKIYWNNNKWKYAIRYLFIVIEELEKLNVNKKDLALSYYYYGYSMQQIGNIELAYKSYIKCHKIENNIYKLNDNCHIFTLKALREISFELGYIKESAKYLSDLIKILLLQNEINYKDISAKYISLSNLYSLINNKKKSIIALKKSITNDKVFSIVQIDKLISILIKISEIYFEIEDYENAIIYALKAYQANSKNNGENKITNRKGTIYLHLGRCYSKINSIELALTNYLQFLQFTSKNDFFLEMAIELNDKDLFDTVLENEDILEAFNYININMKKMSKIIIPNWIIRNTK